LQRRLARAGLTQQAHEGALDFSQRVSIAKPKLAASMAQITHLYLQLRYLQTAGPGKGAPSERQLAQAVSALKI